MKKDDERKLISAGGTLVVMAILFIFMIFCGFSYLDPPPAPKKVIMIELEEEFGNGHKGGGNHQEGGSQGNDNAPPHDATQTAKPKQNTNTKRQNNRTDSRSSVSDNSSAQSQGQTVNNRALFPGSASSGQGNGQGMGAGSGQGNGLGLGDAGSGGSGTGIGTGTGHRPYRGTPNLKLDVDETPGSKVYVKVEVTNSGDVVDATIMNDKNHRTTASASTQKKCIARAMKVKYNKGEHEYRIIVFTF